VCYSDYLALLLFSTQILLVQMFPLNFTSFRRRYSD